MGVERVLRRRHPESKNDASAGERRHHLGNPLGGYQDVGGEESHHRDDGHQAALLMYGPALCQRGCSASSSSRDAVIAPINLSPFITAANGQRNLAMIAATSMMVSS